MNNSSESALKLEECMHRFSNLRKGDNDEANYVVVVMHPISF